jgi:hypothetical protein
MPAYIVFVQELTFERFVAKICRSKVQAVEAVVVAEFWSLEKARARSAAAAHQESARPRLDSWLADMEYCDRF